MLFDKAQRKLWRHGLPRCMHLVSRFVTVTTAAGARSIRQQCSDCGCLDSTVYKLADHPDAGPADADAAASWQAKRKDRKSTRLNSSHT